MAIFSPKARRLVESAVQQLPDDVQREIWKTWSIANPDVRRPDDVVAVERLPNGAAAVALGALERMKVTLLTSLENDGFDEDEISDIENDISFIGSVESLLIEGLQASRRAA